MKLKKSTLASALAVALGSTGMIASAATTELTMNWSGFFTMLNPTGGIMQNVDYASYDTVYTGNRTPITGTMTYCTSLGGTNTSCGSLNAGQGSITVTPFSFFGGGAMPVTSFGLQAIPSSTLLLGNLAWNWPGSTGIPASIVLDASGFLSALTGGIATSSTIAGSGALAASENTNMGGSTAKPKFLPLGPHPIATTTWNTTDIGTIALGSYPSGTLPLLADTVVDTGSCNLVGTSCGATLDTGVGGSPMMAGPFHFTGTTIGYNMNFDFTSLHVTSVVTTTDAVPVPAAVWLFGSGLAGLLGVARRRAG